MEKVNSLTQQESTNVDPIEEKHYKPNQIPASQRLFNLFASVFLLAHGTYGLLINDLYIASKRSRGIHLHDMPAWVMFGAFVSGCLVMISVCLDHYDSRNNEIKYQKFANTFKPLAWIFFALSLSMQMTNFDGNFKSLPVLIAVFAISMLLLFWANRLMEKRLHKDKLQIEMWKEVEESNLSEFFLTKSILGSSLIEQDTRTMQYTEEPRYIENTLEGFTVKRILRNVNGDYFYWLWSSDSPRYVKQITQVNAKILLKNDYIAP